MIDVFLEKLQSEKLSFWSAFFNKSAIIKAKMYDLGFWYVKEYLSLLREALSEDRCYDVIFDNALINLLIKSGNGEKHYSYFFKKLKRYNLQDLPFKTIKVKSVLYNTSTLEVLTTKEEISLKDYNLEEGKTYLLILCNDNYYLIPTETKIPIDSLKIIEKNRTKEVSLKTKVYVRDFNLENFYDGRVKDVSPLEIPVEGKKDTYYLYFKGERTLNSIKVINDLMIEVISKGKDSSSISLYEILRTAKKNGAGKLKGIENLTMLFNKYADSPSFLDNKFYYINRKNVGNIYIITDLHGSRLAFMKIMEKLKEERVDFDRDLIVFLGDFVDRGKYPLWVLYHVFKLKRKFSKNIIILKGNHESYKINENGEIICYHDPHEFYDYMMTTVYKEDKTAFSQELIELIFKNLFKELPIGVFIKIGDRKTLLAHSGFTYPQGKIKDPDFWDYFKAKRENYPNFDRYSYLNSLSDFNDPETSKGFIWTRIVANDYRDDVYTISKEIAKYSQNNFMDKFDIDLIIRGHDHPEKGIEIVKKDGSIIKNDENLENRTISDAKIITFLSSGGNEDLSDFQRQGAYIIKINKENEIIPINIGNHKKEVKNSKVEKENHEKGGKDG